MYKVGIIFTFIFVSLQRGRCDQLNNNIECCHESVLLNNSLPNCADVRCSYLSENTTGIDETYTPLYNKVSSSLLDERPSEHTTNYGDVISWSASASIEPPSRNEWRNDFFNSVFYRYSDRYIKINISYRFFHFSPYYYCKIVPRSKTFGSLHIKCPRENTMECCPPGNLIFEKDEESGSFWECSLKTDEIDYWEYLKKAPKGQQPHILLHDNFYQNYYNTSKGSMEGPYIIVRSVRPYANDSDGFLELNNLYFERKFNCNVEEMCQELVCGKNPFVAPFHKVYAVLRCSCIAFGGATLLVFILLPPLRTMKTSIIICQTFSYFLKDLVDMRSSLGGWQPSYTECIAVAYNLHYWDLAASFWGNVMSIDLALTFRGRGFYRGKDRRTFLWYSLYGWGGPLIITVVTAILASDMFQGDFLRPDINYEFCWFHSMKISLYYHYLPAMILAALNIPLLGYTVYKIIKTVCASDILHNADSGRNFGHEVKKESRTRFILYFNLALLIGSPKSLQFVKLLFDQNDAVLLALNTTGLMRAICMFLFVICKKGVFKLMKERLLFGSLSHPSGFTSLSSKAYDIKNSKVSNSVPQESTPL